MPQAPPTHRVSPLTGALTIATLFLAIGFGYTAHRAYRVCQFPYQVDPEEGFILYQARELAEGRSFYRPLDAPPFVAGTYAPLFQAIASRGSVLIIEGLMVLALALIFSGFLPPKGWPWAWGAAGAFGGLLQGVHWITVGGPSWGLEPWIAAAIAWGGFALLALVVGVFFGRTSGMIHGLLSAGLVGVLFTIYQQWGPVWAPHRLPDAMLAVRLPAIISEGLCGLLIALNVYWLGRSHWVSAFFAGLLFFVAFEVYEWTGFGRVDFTALALNLAGLTCLTRFGRSEARGFWLVLSLFCFVLVAITKQSQIMAPGAACLYLLSDRPRLGLLYTFSLALAVAGVVGVLHGITGGQYWIHTVTYNANQFDFGQIGILRHLWTFKYPVWIALALLGARHIWQSLYFRNHFWEAFDLKPLLDCSRSERSQWEVLQREIKDQGHWDWTLVYLILALASLAGWFKAGASVNYMLDPWAAICLYLGVRFGQDLSRLPLPKLKPHRGLRIMRGLTAAAVLLMVFHSVRVLRPLEPTEYDAIRERQAEQPLTPRLALPPTPSAEDLQAARAVETEIRRAVKAGGRILTELPIFEVRTGQPVHWQPFIMQQLVHENKWDDTPMIQAFERADFDLIVATDLLPASGRHRNYTDGMLRAIASRYRLKGQQAGDLFKYSLYTPGP